MSRYDSAEMKVGTFAETRRCLKIEITITEAVRKSSERFDNGSLAVGFANPSHLFAPEQPAANNLPLVDSLDGTVIALYTHIAVHKTKLR